MSSLFTFSSRSKGRLALTFLLIGLLSSTLLVNAHLRSLQEEETVPATTGSENVDVSGNGDTTTT